MAECAGVIWDATLRLFNCCKVEAAYVYNLEENLVSLEEKWQHLQNLTTKVETRIKESERPGVRQSTTDVNNWLEDVKKLQEVMKNIKDSQQAGHGTCKCCPRNCNWSGYKLGKKVVKTLSSVDKLLSEGKNFDRVDVTCVVPSNPANEMFPVEAEGLDLMFNQVWNAIKDENMGIIALYGIGGVGKTTLLKMIHNEFGKTEHGSVILLWVVVSRDHDINKIMDDIRKGLGIDDETWGEIRQEEQKAAKIYKILKGNKFVLMLDDLWKEVELQEIGVPNPKKTNNQSKVLFTTRFKNVCDKMGANKSFQVEPLPKKEAFDLFCEKVGEKTLNSHSEILKIAEKMAEECEGLPLALITIGRAMAGVESVEAWSEALKDLKGSNWTTDSEMKVFSRLKVSYDKLPDETHKRCFLYCALYPDDFEIDVGDLIDGWIGEGFLGEEEKSNTNNDAYEMYEKGKSVIDKLIPKAFEIDVGDLMDKWIGDKFFSEDKKSCKSVYEMYEKGRSILEKLKHSCLLEDVEYIDGKHRWMRSSIKMHDVIRDMALWLAHDEDRNKDKILVEGGALAASEMSITRLKVVEKISIINARGSWKLPVCPNLLTLWIKGMGVNITDYSNLPCMIRMKVLDLSGCYSIDHLPREIGKLINLEFLNLSRTMLKSQLPIELKNLKKLRVLLMESVGFGLELVPLEVIESLKQLKVFRYFSSVYGIPNSNSIEMQFLEKLEWLPKLEELCIELNTYFAMLKLLSSTKLQSCSREFLLSYTKEPHNDEFELDPLDKPQILSYLSKMEHLEFINIEEVNIDIDEGSSITNKFHFQKLRWVSIYEFSSITHLTWLRYAPLLEGLNVDCCGSIEEVMKDVGNEDNSCDILINLKRLLLTDLPELKSIYKSALVFPRLEFIHIEGCPKLRKLPLNSSSAKNNLIAIRGDKNWWNNLEWEDKDTAFQDFLLSKFQPF